MGKSRFSVSLLGAAALVVGTVGAAYAAVTINDSGDSVSVYGDAGANTITVTCDTDVVQAPPASGGTCSALSRLNVYPYAGTDTVDLTGVTRADFPGLFQVSVTSDETLGGGGSAEADTIQGSPLNDSVTADVSDTVYGNAGADRIDGAGTAYGGPGDDFIKDPVHDAYGGPGNDIFEQAAGDSTNGGPGFDTYRVNFYTGYYYPKMIFTVTNNAFTLKVPNVGQQTVVVTGMELYEWTLPSTYQQVFNAKTFSGQVHVYGLGGPDTITGTKHDDLLDGGSGNDVLRGGPGSDWILGGPGNDVIYAKDGVRDIVNCGGGKRDKVTADHKDILKGCEVVKY